MSQNINPEVTNTKSSKDQTKEVKEIDLTRFGDNPNPAEMNSPEKRHYSKILFAKSNDVMGFVNQAMARVN